MPQNKTNRATGAPDNARIQAQNADGTVVAYDGKTYPRAVVIANYQRWLKSRGGDA